MFYNIGRCCKCYKKKFGIIYISSGVFPYDLLWGYTDSSVISTIKSLITLAPGHRDVAVQLGEFVAADFRPISPDVFLGQVEVRRQKATV
jgi:hypothetical protein